MPSTSDTVTLIIDNVFLTTGGAVWVTNEDKLWYNGSSLWASGSNDTVKGSLGYSFQGTSIAFVGNTPHTQFSQTFGVSIDFGSEFDATYPVAGINCQWYTTPQLPDGMVHTVELSGLDQTDVDYVLVTAGNSTQLTGQTIFVDDSSSEITWEGTWAINFGYTLATGEDPANPAGNGTHASQSKGDSFSFQFAGTSILVGGIFSHQASGSITATFSVDSESTSQTFTPPLTSNGLVASDNFVYFQNDSLSLGNHTLIVNVTDVTGNSSLVIDYLAYSPSFDFISQKPNFMSTGTTGVASPSASNGSTGSGSGSPTNYPASSKASSHVSTGAIAGGVVGGIVGIGALLLLAFYFRHRKTQRSRLPRNTIQPFSTVEATSQSEMHNRKRFHSALPSSSYIMHNGDPGSANTNPLISTDRMSVMAGRYPELRQRMDEIAELMRQMSDGPPLSSRMVADVGNSATARVGELQERIDALIRENAMLVNLYVTPPAYEGGQEGSVVGVNGR